jgi:hypothetical protein
VCTSPTTAVDHTIADFTQVHDPDYRAALQDFTTFTGKLSEKVIEVDELIPELPVKDVVSTTHTDASTVLTSDRSIVSTGVYSSQRSIKSNMLNRVDIRFSKDPTPYKTYFSAAWSRTGRKGPYAHYYVQIQHGGGSFVGELMQSFLDSHIYSCCMCWMQPRMIHRTTCRFNVASLAYTNLRKYPHSCGDMHDLAAPHDHMARD